MSDRYPAMLYRVDAYPYGCAHDDDGSRAFLTVDLSTALYALADEVDDYVDYLAEQEDYLLSRERELLEKLETVRDRPGHAGTFEDLEDVREELDDARRTLGFLEVFESSLKGWAHVASGGFATAGQLEYLDGALIRLTGSAELRGAGLSESFDEPGSIARGMVFELERVSVSELDPETLADALESESGSVASGLILGTLLLGMSAAMLAPFLTAASVI